MKGFIITLVVVTSLFFFGRGQCSKKNMIITEHRQTSPTHAEQPPAASTPSGWEPIMVDDGFTWFTPKDTSKTTEWFDISRWNIMDRLKKPAVMEFKTKNGNLVTFKVDETGKYLKNPDGSFEEDRWSDKEYTEVFHNSTDIRYHPIPGDCLEVRVARRSY